jgi:hypothetical protein
MSEPLPEEQRAVELLFKKETGEEATFASIDEARRQDLLRRIRQREVEIEHFVLHDMLVHKLSEGRRFPRRHQLVALAFAALALCLFALVSMIWR